MRILLITDSLGCPRDEIDVADTWTDRIISKWSGENIHFYTLCKGGQTANDIDVNYVKYISPDLIFIQVGIVDACRRALGRRESWLIQRIPVVRSIIRKLCSKYHYLITKGRNIHYCSIDKFRNTLYEIKKMTGSKVVFISIAPPQEMLLEKVYHVQEDVDEYNDSVRGISGVLFLDPYIGTTRDFILPDGHHLNLCGQDMVFSAVDKFMSEYLQEDNHE